MIADVIENKVVTLRTLGEILFRVVNNAICADRSDHGDVRRAAHAGHICAE